MLSCSFRGLTMFFWRFWILRLVLAKTAYCWVVTPWRLVNNYLSIYQMAGVTSQRIWNCKWLLFQSFRLRFLRVLMAPILSTCSAHLILFGFTTLINYEASSCSLPYSQLSATVPVFIRIFEDSPENFVLWQTHDMAWFRMPVFALSRSQNIAVGIETCYVLDGSGFESRQGQETYSCQISGFVFDCWILEDGTQWLPRNVRKQLPTYVA